MKEPLPMNPELLPKVITDAYKMFDQLNLSVTSLVVIGVVLSLLFLFAAREAAAWFFKVDDVKKDVRKLRQLVIDLEGEMRSLQGLLNQNIALASAKVNEDATSAASVANEVTPLRQESASGFSNVSSVANEGKKLFKETPAKFSINH